MDVLQYFARERIGFKLISYGIIVPFVLLASAVALAINALGATFRFILTAYFSYPVGAVFIAAPIIMYFTDVQIDPDPYKSTIINILLFTQGMTCIGTRFAINSFDSQDSKH